MSKKIFIPSNNIRCDLSELFHSFMLNEYVDDSYMDYDDEMRWLMSQGYVFDDYGNYYDDGDDDDEDVIWPPAHQTKKTKGKKKGRSAYDEFWAEETRRSKKHKHHKRKGGCRIIDITEPYSGDEEHPREIDFADYEELGDDDGILNGKEIYYYPDYHDKDGRLEFESLSAFNDFCEDNGYTVPERVANDIMFRRISHTCLNPTCREWGCYEIMAEESYGSMFYEVCDSSELG